MISVASVHPVSRACVLGARGFVGRSLVAALAAQGVPVRELSRQRPSAHPDATTMQQVQGDLLDPGFDPTPLLDDCTVVFNCVGELRDESLMHALHVEATAHLLEHCLRRARQTGQPVHWVQLSSVGAYGPPQGPASTPRCVTEISPLEPRGAYEITKARADELIVQAAQTGDITYSILRPSIIFGPNMPNSSLRQLISVIKAGRFAYIGSTDAISTYVHIDDVVTALLQCACNSAARNQVFNISNDTLQTDFVEAVTAYYSTSPPKLRLPESVARLASHLFSWKRGFPLTQSRIDALVARTAYPIAKLQQELGTTPEKSITQYFMDALIQGRR